MKTELETIALQILKQIEQQTQQELNSMQKQIQVQEKRQEEFNQQLLHLSGLYRNLQPLVEQLSNILPEKGLH